MLNPAKRRNSLLLLSFVMVLAFDVALASQEVVYKEPRPLKKIFEKESVGEQGEDAKGKTYLYDPTGKTDPFESFIAKREEVEEEEKKKPKTYLETLELSQLELTVILIGPKGKWAMVKDSKGLGHVVREGTPIGTNGGVVYNITEGEVVIREEYRDFRGRKQFKDVSKKTPAIR
ncbi:MAG: pilus assembly protein PilP [Pseudomonadota bacterium]